MTTKRQAEICVERNLSDDEIVEMTGCHPECVEFVRAWGRGERVECFTLGGKWIALEDQPCFDRHQEFWSPGDYRIAPRRIHVKATLPDGTEREAEFPEPVRRPREGDCYWVSLGNFCPERIRWTDFRHETRGWRQSGRLFRTYGEALERDKAMIWISGGEVE